MRKYYLMTKYKKITPKITQQINSLLNEGKSIKVVALKLNVSAHSVFKTKNNIVSYRRGNRIDVSSISDKMFNDLNNIASNLGLKMPAFMKKEYKKIIDSYPEKMKQKKPAN